MTPEPGSDGELLARARSGDGAAFGLLFREYSSTVYTYCFHRLGSWSGAEDATSVVFLEAWRRRADAVAVSGSLRPWLLGVATNVVRNQTRAARRYDAALYRLPPAEVEPDPADEVVARLDDEQRMREILREIAVLNRGERDVVALVAMAGLSYTEAAVALGVPVGTIRSRLARARARLAKARATGTGAFQDSVGAATPVTDRHGRGVV
ncbi:RNA polymerase sigma factor, sigma-70 family [Candidatus Protofrankia californiensis]|uniref:RNA polymerase sigma factor, sigma-70 family n=1 Tax=Candidatus Protofrankia californiensis TaxID=1839754 RepID=A0A1C3NU59_9ACTN|nr:RNA polymerase sigma factor, sigma-70 family [Candidatus Protofrankia californiensis]